jgi:hypothetical protein
MAAKFSSMLYNALPPTAKNFQATAGIGWCVDSDGKESQARNFVKMSCESAQNMCQHDAMCTAFACAALDGRSVLYTTTGCQADCDKLDWQKNPSLVVGASCNQTNSRNQYHNWAQGICYVQMALTDLSAQASPGDTSFSVTDSSMFASGDGVRISSVEVKTSPTNKL